MKAKCYKDRRARENAWKRVSAATGLTIDTCSKKWKNVRDKYVKELRKVKYWPSGGQGPPPSWTYFSVMSFLEDSLTQTVFFISAHALFTI